MEKRGGIFAGWLRWALSTPEKEQNAERAVLMISSFSATTSKSRSTIICTISSKEISGSHPSFSLLCHPLKEYSLRQAGNFDQLPRALPVQSDVLKSRPAEIPDGPVYSRGDNIVSAFSCNISHIARTKSPAYPQSRRASKLPV